MKEQINALFSSKWAPMALAAAGILMLPVVLMAFPNATQSVLASDGSNGKSRAPEAIGTTLAFDNGRVVTVKYENIYFCNSSGPETNATSSPCKVGQDASKDPVPDSASNTLEVIVPAFLGFGGITPSSPSNSITGLPGSNSIFDPTLGANNFTQCPDSTGSLHCINHPHFLDLSPNNSAVVPLPVHTHILSHGVKAGQGGWWKLNTWLVKDPSIWPNPKTGECSAGSGCLTSEDALQMALQNHQVTQVVGPVPTTAYLFFNIVGGNQ
jgi:hypothetical protein